MICMKCADEGKRSRVVDLGGSVTLMTLTTFWDEDGNRHHHDPNTRQNSYRCSNGHVFSAKFKSPCMAVGCDYNRAIEVELTYHDN